MPSGAVSVSRSTLAERFAQLVGDPPMQYLTRWRMQVAARLLADGEAKVSAVARPGLSRGAGARRRWRTAAG
jgi:AraC-like DNA-binding protein